MNSLLLCSNFNIAILIMAGIEQLWPMLKDFSSLEAVILYLPLVNVIKQVSWNKSSLLPNIQK